MSKVNLLPESYVRAADGRRSVAWSLALSAVLLAAGAAWAIGAWTQLRIAEREADAATATLAAERSTHTELQRQQSGRAGAAADASLEAELADPLPPTAVVTLLARLVPERVALTRLAVTAPPLAAPAPARKAPAAPIARSKARQPEAPPARLLKLEIDGAARSDADVARCVSVLADHGLFTNVKLAKSRQAGTADSPRVAFQITLEVPVDRTFIFPTKEGQADAS